MKIRVTKVGTRHRIVLPPDVLEALGVDAGDTLFFVISSGARGPEVRLSRSPETFDEYLLLHSEPLPFPEEVEEVDDRQLRFSWWQQRADHP